MANKRLSMRKIREVLRLSWDKGLSARRVAESCGVARGTVGNVVERATKTGLSWPLPDDLDDAALEHRLFPSTIPLEVERRNMPSFNYLQKELTRKHVTLQLLWHEYKEKNPDGYEYSQFCLRYRSWQKTLEVSLRQDYKAGERLFVDFAGDTIPIHDPKTGTITPASLFVAALGASNYTYGEAVLSQDLRSWISLHVHTFEFMGAVPDNPLSRGDPSLPLRARSQPDLPGYGCPLPHGGHSGEGEKAEG
jgi:transposase